MFQYQSRTRVETTPRDVIWAWDFPQAFNGGQQTWIPTEVTPEGSCNRAVKEEVITALRGLRTQVTRVLFHNVFFEHYSLD
jgi:hypothetical protein